MIGSAAGAASGALCPSITRPLDEAIIAYQDAVAVFRGTGDGLQRGIALGTLGMALTSQRLSGPGLQI